MMFGVATPRIGRRACRDDAIHPGCPSPSAIIVPCDAASVASDRRANRASVVPSAAPPDGSPLFGDRVRGDDSFVCVTIFSLGGGVRTDP